MPEVNSFVTPGHEIKQMDCSGGDGAAANGAFSLLHRGTLSTGEKAAVLKDLYAGISVIYSCAIQCKRCGK